MDFDLELTGFDLAETDGLIEGTWAPPERESLKPPVPEVLPPGPVGDDEAEFSVPPAPTSVAGDVWILGDHRVMCGDSTSIDAVTKLMGGDQADLIVTDPPYNVAYEGYTEDKLTIQSDDMSPEQFVQFLTDVFISYFAVAKKTVAMYVFHPSSYQREFQNAALVAAFSRRWPSTTSPLDRASIGILNPNSRIAPTIWSTTWSFLRGFRSYGRKRAISHVSSLMCSVIGCKLLKLRSTLGPAGNWKQRWKPSF